MARNYIHLNKLTMYMVQSTSPDNPYEVSTISNATGISDSTVRRLLHSHAAAFPCVVNDGIQQYYFVQSPKGIELLNRAKAAYAKMTDPVIPVPDGRPAHTPIENPIRANRIAELELKLEEADTYWHNHWTQHVDTHECREKMFSDEEENKIVGMPYEEIWDKLINVNLRTVDQTELYKLLQMVQIKLEIESLPRDEIAIKAEERRATVAKQETLAKAKEEYKKTYTPDKEQDILNLLRGG